MENNRNKQISVMITLVITILLINVISANSHGISDADKQAMLEGGYLEYIRLGATHMLTGYDHLLFLFGVIFFLSKFKDIVKFISVFTLGHCITLIFATFMNITANYYLIDAVIALTVCYKGFDNLDGFQNYLKMKSPNLVFFVFIFGLIHGFGLSTRLQQLPLGDSGLLLKIISFNIGVEFGQIVALALMLVLLSTWRKTASFKQFSTASNFLLICAGVFLFMMQMHGYSHQFSDEHTSHTIAQIQSSTSDEWQDIVTIKVPPNKGLEYKFYIHKRGTLEYTWKTDGGELYFDLHGEPKGENTGFPEDHEESYQEGTTSESSGTVVVPFEGSHGWWWKNNGSEEVTIELKTNGAYKILGLL